MICNKVLKSRKGKGVWVGGGRMGCKYKIRQPLCEISGLSYKYNMFLYMLKVDLEH